MSVLLWMPPSRRQRSSLVLRGVTARLFLVVVIHQGQFSTTALTMIHPYNNNHHLKQKTSPGTVPTNNHGAGMPSYLDSLARTTTEAEEDPASAGMPDEEYYGCTNPMANNWPGSKHETYGGYLHRLTPPPSKPKVPTQSSLSEASPPPPDEWYGKDRPMASWKGYRDSQWGGYLDSLSSSSSSNNHDSDNDNNNSQ